MQASNMWAKEPVCWESDTRCDSCTEETANLGRWVTTTRLCVQIETVKYSRMYTSDGCCFAINSVLPSSGTITETAVFKFTLARSCIFWVAFLCGCPFARGFRLLKQFSALWESIVSKKNCKMAGERVGGDHLLSLSSTSLILNRLLTVWTRIATICGEFEKWAYDRNHNERKKFFFYILKI